VTKDKAIQKGLKIQALTNSPVPGEATAARDHLTRFMANHGLTEADLVEVPAASGRTVIVVDPAILDDLAALGDIFPKPERKARKPRKPKERV
jgi:hypothetical protein